MLHPVVDAGHYGLMEATVAVPAQSSKPDRTLVAILIVVGLLVVIALVVVVARSSARQTFDASTPEGVVQRYAQAVIDDDDATAAQYLVPLAKQCEFYYEDDYNDSAKVRLTLQSTELRDDAATVKVSVSTSHEGYGGGPFSNSEYSHDDEFRLVKSGETWLIDSAPYEFISCTEAWGTP